MKAYHERDQALPQERPENRDAENGEENAEESPIKEIHELLKKEEIHRIWKQKGIGKKRKRSEVDGEDVEAEMRRKKNEESYEPRFSAF